MLQGFQRGDAAVHALQFALRLLLLAVHLLQLLAQLLQLFVGLLLRGGQLLEVHLADRQLLAQLQHRRIFRVGHQQLALVFQTPLALGQALQALLQLLNARLLDF